MTTRPISDFRLLPCVVAVSVALACALLTTTAAAAQPAEPDADEAKTIAREAVRNLIRRIEHAWTSPQGVDIMADVLSPRAFAWAAPLPGNRQQALVLNRVAFLAVFSQALQREPPLRHEHDIRSLVVEGPMAWEVGDVRHVGPAGRERRTRVLNVFARENEGWRLLFSTPADNVRRALDKAEDKSAER